MWDLFEILLGGLCELVDLDLLIYVLGFWRFLICGGVAFGIICLIFRLIANPHVCSGLSVPVGMAGFGFGSTWEWHSRSDK